MKVIISTFTILGAIACGEPPAVQGGCVPYDDGWQYQECVDYTPEDKCIVIKNGERRVLGDAIIKNSPETCMLGTKAWEVGLRPPIFENGGLR